MLVPESELSIIIDKLQLQNRGKYSTIKEIFDSLEDTDMEYRNYKKSSEKISLLGLGNMRLPKLHEDAEDIDTVRAQQIVDYAYDHGVNYYDTAYMYHGGKSEKFIGQALKKYDRSTFYLATKMPIWMAETPEEMKQIFENQLINLQTDYIDFYLFHSLTRANFDKCVNFGLYEYLSEKKEQGIIRNLGFSFHDTPEVLEQICSTYEWDFAQIQLNYLDWEMQNAKRQYEILEQHGIPCIIMEPVRGGKLVNTCDAANEIFTHANPHVSVASWAIRYAASLPNVLTVLSGMSNMEQIQDNINTLTDFTPMTQEEYKIVERAVYEYKKKDTVPCTGCRYCMDCANGVDIPKSFELYNKFVMNNDLAAYKKEYFMLDESTRENQCIACGICAQHCPQGIDIPDKLQMIQKRISDLF